MVIKIYGPQMNVTERAKSIEQPRGGYVKRVNFEEIPLGPGEEVLHEDVVCSSPSAAGWVVIGRSNNGWSEWKDKKGKKIDSFRVK